MRKDTMQALPGYSDSGAGEHATRLRKYRGDSGKEVAVFSVFLVHM